MRTKASDALGTAVKPKLSQVELAKQLGVTKQAVQGYLNGDFQPSPDLMAKIEDLLGIPMRAWTEAPESANEAEKPTGS
jgi:transcriptional regulator with XRE-family HTH domain